MSVNLPLNMFILQVLGALGTEQNRPSSAAQCVAYIALTEIPVGQWPNLIERLVANVTTPGATDMTKESTLEAIGYICQVRHHCARKCYRKLQ